MTVPDLMHVFPLDGRGRRARLWLPDDLTAAEAVRVAEMVRALAVPPSEGTDKP